MQYQAFLVRMRRLFSYQRAAAILAVLIGISCILMVINKSTDIRHMLALTVQEKPSQHRSLQMWRHVRICIFMTTHMSGIHRKALSNCWPEAIRSVPLLRRAHLILFSPAKPQKKVVDTVFSQFRSYKFVNYTNPGYQSGAILPMVRAFDEHWFDDYDWVIRLNPDVIIRDDKFLMKALTNVLVDGVFVKCGDKIHTDFQAFRPKAVVPYAAHRPDGSGVNKNGVQKQSNAEYHAREMFKEILSRGNYVYLEGAHSNGWACRVVGVDSPVIHDHGYVYQCPDLYKHDKNSIWRN